MTTYKIISSGGYGEKIVLYSNSTIMGERVHLKFAPHICSHNWPTF